MRVKAIGITMLILTLGIAGLLVVSGLFALFIKYAGNYAPGIFLGLSISFFVIFGTYNEVSERLRRNNGVWFR